jgi:copper chaperone
MARARLKVMGMTCGHCVAAVTRALENVAGVSEAQVDLQAGRAVVDYDEGKTTTRQLVGAVMDEGYTAEEAS